MLIDARRWNDESHSQHKPRRIGPGLRRDDIEYAVRVFRHTHTGNAVEYFTWLNAKLDSIEAMPSRRVSLFFRKAS